MDSEQERESGENDGGRNEPAEKEAAAKEEVEKRAERPATSFSWSERVGYGF